MKMDRSDLEDEWADATIPMMTRWTPSVHRVNESA
jgi:hypothetical protein